MIRIKTEATNRALMSAMFGWIDSYTSYVVEEIRAKPINIVREYEDSYLVKITDGSTWKIPKTFCETT